MVQEYQTIARRQLAGIAASAIGRPRPSFLTEELFAVVCERVAGGETLKAIARELGFNESSFRGAIATDSQLTTRYQSSRLLQAEAWSDQIVEISDDKSGDIITKTLKDGTEVEVQDSEFIARSKVRVDTRKWLMAKLHPKKFGERLEVEQKITHEVGDSVFELLSGIRSEASQVIDVPVDSGELVLEPLPIEQPIQPDEEVC